MIPLLAHGGFYEKNARGFYVENACPPVETPSTLPVAEAEREAEPAGNTARG
jgi:hypothetical protein